ncbi:MULTISPECIES: RNA polymerase sigma factor [unclassified Sphingobacterium]|uniref:RNA polymerase sigma factor n=1 Tax=unclassified Sphingobacterium TaxID=2609468 RepID=UPI00104E834E|nr:MULTISPECIES: sigma-70 family RNA polymerase sigma factor [unclassified Sphingobacterium]MCS3552453.1 RNA polymerase sigma factor (sigma-70 family) [Sphingobacterium sp. JUb21]TCR10785.1 RNA polymerase sigma factor (sigma-70 family) [Sphingobacterium sp. JUb20]
MKLLEHDNHEWNNFCAGNRTSFKVIYENYFNSLFLYGLRFTDNHEVIKDIIQNLFFKLWENRKSLQDIKQPRSYLHRALRNLLLNSQRDSKQYLHEPIDEEHYSFQLDLPIESTIIREEERLEIHKQLKDAFRHLTSKQKEMLYLKYVKQLSFKEIAEILEISIKGTYKLHQRAIQSLRAQLGQIGNSLFSLIVLYFQIVK